MTSKILWSAFGAALFASQTLAASTGGSANDFSKSQFASEWTGLSKKCQKSLGTIVDNKSELSKCSGIGELFENVVSSSAVNPDKSLVKDVQNWLSNELCSDVPCDDSVLNAAAGSLGQDCKAELEKQRWMPTVAQMVMLNYPAARDAVCLKDIAAGNNATSFCPAEVINNVEKSGTPFTYKQAQIAIGDPQAAIMKIPTWAYCQSCSQGMLKPVINVLQVMNAEWANMLVGAVDGKCGKGWTLTDVTDKLADGTTDAGEGSGSANGSGSGTGSGSGGDESAGYRMQPLATSAAVLVSVAIFAAIRL